MLNAKKTLFILGLLFALRGSALAAPCDLRSLPDSIQTSLAKEYSEWRIVTPGRLEKSDRETWLQNYAKDCPGIAMGQFSTEENSYVLNLLKNANGKIYQQIIYFESFQGEFRTTVIFPSTAIQIVTVIRKFAPGKYKPSNGGKSLFIKTDTIGLSQIDAWTEVYYWDGSRFRKMVTSD